MTSEPSISECSLHDIVDIFKYISNIDYVFTENLFKPDKEIRHMLMLMDPLMEDTVLVHLFSFFIHFYTRAFYLNIKSLFSLFLKYDSVFEDKIILIFKVREHKQIRVYISLLIMILGLVPQIWEKFKRVSSFFISLA